jgi:two-component system response regulator HupR/HoxA
MCVLCDGEAPLGPNLLSAGIAHRAKPESTIEPSTPLTLKERVEALECIVIRESLQRNGRNISRVAEELGLSRVGLRSKIARYDICRDLDDEP